MAIGTGPAGGLHGDAAGADGIVLAWTGPSGDTLAKWRYRYKTSGEYGNWTDMTGSDRGAGFIADVIVAADSP